MAGDENRPWEDADDDGRSDWRGEGDRDSSSEAFDTSDAGNSDQGQEQSPPGGSEFASDGAAEDSGPGERVLRMDDDIDAFSDDDFPLPQNGDATEAPDPGYAAFAADLDDPLADWPSPDASLDDLPETRSRAQAPPGEESAAEPAWRDPEGRAETGAEDSSFTDADEWAVEESESDLPEAFFDDPVDDDDRRAPAPPEAEFGEPAPAPVAADSEAAGANAPAPNDAAMTESPTQIETAQETAAASDSIASTGERAYEAVAPVTAAMGSAAGIAAGIEDGDEAVDARGGLDDEAASRTRGDGDDDVLADEVLVDDFLNELDEPEAYDDIDDDINDNIDEVVTSRQEQPAYGAGIAAEQQREAALPLSFSSTVERAVDETDAGRDLEDHAEQTGESAGSAIPWPMIAVVVIGLALLGAGGYGVIQQRGALESEIRELQAQLATALTPQQAAAERELLRQVERENESLLASVAALEGENAALSEQLAGLEARLEESAAAEETARASAEAARTAAARRANAAASAPAAPAAPAVGDWFVNFGSYAQRPIADRWASRIEVDRGTVRVQEADAGGRSLFRVRVVGLGSRDEAERIAAALERQYQLPRLWIGKD
jgi:hypothetical protein